MSAIRTTQPSGRSERIMMPEHTSTASPIPANAPKASPIPRASNICGYLTALLVLLSPALGVAQTGSAMPIPIFQGMDATGSSACSSCKLYAFETGTTTPLATYSDSTLSTAHAHPIVLNSAGRATVYLIPGRTYRFRLDTSADVTVWGPIDGVASLHAIAQDRLRLASHAETIATGVISVGASQITIDTEGAAASDDLDTINLDSGSGLGAGSMLVIRPANVSRVVTVKHGTGNVRLVGGDARLAFAGSSLTLLYDGSNWIELARAGGGQTVVTTTSTGTQHDFDPGIIGDTVIRANNASTLTITGFAKGVNGQRITVKAVNAVVEFDHADTGSTSGQRLQNIATSANTPINTGGFATFVFDATASPNVWRLTAHEQGAWITPTFAAGSYAGNGSMTWTVAAGDLSSQAYRLNGRTMSVTWSINTTDVGGTPNTQLLIGNAAWGSFTAAKVSASAGWGRDNGTLGLQLVSTAASGTQIIIQNSAAGNWTASTANTTVNGTHVFEVN